MRAILGAGCSATRPRDGPPLWFGALAVTSAGAGRAARVELVEVERDAGPRVVTPTVVATSTFR
jgi:hypothetical protein